MRRAALMPILATTLAPVTAAAETGVPAASQARGLAVSPAQGPVAKEVRVVMPVEARLGSVAPGAVPAVPGPLARLAPLAQVVWLVRQPGAPVAWQVLAGRAWATVFLWHSLR